LSRYFKAKVTKNLSLNQKNNLLCIEPLESIVNPFPGQFYMIAVNNAHDPLLKRPFSYFKKTSGSIHFLYTIRGKGTELMRDLRQGEIIHIIGPLGTGYPKPEDGSVPLLVAGGTGVASIFALAEGLFQKAYFLHGAKCKDEFLMLDEMKQLERTPIVCMNCTDDGSFGGKGTVVDVLNTVLASESLHVSSCVLYACGPKLMLESISKKVLDYGIKGYISLEENMACGVGACLGCAVKTVHGYKRVCKEGPVFPLEEIVW
jgi:dihydroorotate dehydrogenase electron transfer subunit